MAKSSPATSSFSLHQPDVLILDEPNHLDIRSVSALEKFLVDFEGSVLNNFSRSRPSQ